MKKASKKEFYGNIRRKIYTPDGISRDGNSGFAYLENLYIDKDSPDGALESIPGFRSIYSFESPIEKIFCAEGVVYVLSGRSIYRFESKDRDNLSGLKPVMSVNGECYAMPFGNGLIVCDADRLVRLDRSGEVKLISSSANICACTSLSVYGDSLVLSSNPRLPGQILFLRRGEDGEFTDKEPIRITLPSTVRGLTSAKGILWALTSDGAFGYRYLDGGIKYEYEISGIECTGEALCVCNRTYFMCDGGLFSAESKEYLSYNISLWVSRNAYEIKMTSWRGYLVLYYSECIFLMSEDGEGRPIWFYLKGVGAYSNDRRVFRYENDCLPLGIRAGEKAVGEIISRSNEFGVIEYYVESCDIRHSVYPTEERSGGIYHPAKCFANDASLLYFGAENGELFIFNNDKIGAPSYSMNSLGDDAVEYGEEKRNDLHPDYYSFASHAPTYALITAEDDCGTPDKRKRTMPLSLSVCCKSFQKSSMNLAVICDGSVEKEFLGLCADKINFSDADFSRPAKANMNNPTFALSEGTGYWKKKSIALYSSEYGSPFGILSLGYEYKIRK